MLMNEVIKCGVYARVSTDRQDDSIENQIGQATEFINRLGSEFELDDDCIFIDNAVSGYYTSVFEREAMKKAIELAKENKYKVLVFKEISRVGRDKQENPAIVGMFEQYGVRVIAINDNYDSMNKDNITFDILSVLSEQESKKTSVRVSSARKQRALRGQWGGEAPIGYLVDKESKKLVVDPDKKHIPETIFDLYTNHGLGTFKIAEHLNLKGILTKNNKEWSRSTVRRILSNQAYIGSVVHGTRKNVLKRKYDDTGKMTKKKVQITTDPSEWTVTKNAHEAIIEPEVFYNAQKIINSRTHHRQPRRAYHPLTGILKCSKCGAGMVCQKRTFQTKVYRYYICKTYHKYGRARCSQANINADKIEKAIIDIVKDRLNDISVSKIIASTNRDDDINRLKKEEKSLLTSKNNAEKDSVDIFNQRELFTEEVYKGQMLSLKNKTEAIEEEIAIIRNKITAIEEQSNQTANVSKVVQQFLNLDTKDTSTLRTLLHDLISNIDASNEHLDIEYNYDIL